MGDFIVILIVGCVHVSVCASKGKDAYRGTRRASDTANSWKTVASLSCCHQMK